VEYRVLGPLEVREGDRSLPLGGAKQRALLALLLIDANRVVSRDRLIDELWGDRPPDTAVQTVQVYISRLRKLLGDERIETRAQGYALRAAPDELDVSRFEQLLEAARAAAEPARRAELARSALETFGGEPFADFRAEAFAQAEIARLAELRLEALEERIDADLELGRAAEVVTELEALARAEPQRERVHELLMLSLYRAGRQADALGVYRELRRTFSEELGIEPGPRLRSLERAILAHDPALAPERVPLKLPRQRLPSPPHPLIGREAELLAVEDMLLGDARLVTITGAGGSGKTRVALEVTRALVDRFEHTVFVALAPLVDPELVASTVAASLGVAEVPGRSVDETIADRVGDARLLLVLDNAEHVLDGTLFLAQLLERCPRLSLLVTSRAPLRLTAEHDLPLDPLPAPDAAMLFRARARAVDPAFTADDTMVDAICERLDNLPLAVELAAVHVKVLSPTKLLAGLDDRFDLLTDAPRDAPDRQRTLRRTIDWSYALLPSDAKTLFARMAVFSGGCSAETAHAVCGASPDALLFLVDTSLVRRQADSTVPRFAMLESVRAYAAEQLVASRAESDVRRRHAEHFVELAERAFRDLAGPDQAAALDRLDADIDNLRAALSWSEEGEPLWALRLAGSLGRFWAARGLFREGRQWLDIVAASADLDPEAGARALIAGANFAGFVGDRRRARELCERGLALARSAGSVAWVAKFLTTLAHFDRLDGDGARARARLSEALELGPSGDLGSEAVARSTLALVSIDEGDFPGAADELASSASTLRALGDRSRLAAVLSTLAYVQQERGETDDAGSVLREALRLASEFDDPPLAGEVLLVAAYVETGREPLHAACWLGFAEGVYERAGRNWEPLDRRLRDRAVADLQGILADSELAEARASGGRLSAAQALADALAFVDAAR